MIHAIDAARAILASTPAQSAERLRALEEVAEAARRHIANLPSFRDRYKSAFEDMEDAIAALDAIERGKEGQEVKK